MSDAPPSPNSTTTDVYLVDSLNEGQVSSRQPLPNWRLPLMLFLATCLSTFFVGATRETPQLIANSKIPLFDFPSLDLIGLQIRSAILHQWRDGVTYMVSVLAILLAHEFGHFIATRWYHIRATWPLFLPMPFSPIGTLGAVILMDHRQADRKQIFDVGLAGPLAGLVIAVPLMAWGIRDLRLDLPADGPMIDLPLLCQWFLKWIQPQHSLESGIALNQASPMFMAAWVGFIVTGLNMLPVSQLDGGHVTYALFGRTSAIIGWIFMSAVIFAITVWRDDYLFWFVMATLVMMMGVAHPPTANDRVPLGPFRTVLGVISLLIPVLTFAPKMLY